MFRSLNKLVLVLSFLGGGHVFGEPVSSEEKVAEALKSFEWSLTRRANRFNGKFPNWDVSYGEMDALAMEKRNAEEQIETYDKLNRFYEAMGAEKEAREASNRKRSYEETLRALQRDYNRLRKAGKEEYYPEHQRDAMNRRTEMLRFATKRFAQSASSLNEQETLRFLEGLLHWQPDNRLTGAVDLRQVFGPEYHINDLVREVRRRALDVLAEWGTKEAWEVVARASGTNQPYLAVRMTALQHLMGEMTAEKMQALRSADPENAFLRKVAEMHASKPHTFRRGVKYLDLNHPEAAPVEFNGMAANPDFRKRGAKQRFFPVGEGNASKAGFVEATQKTAPSNRWARMASRFRRLTRPAEPPKPREKTAVPETPAGPTLAEHEAVEKTASRPESQTESRPETSRTPTEPAKRPTVFGNAWGRFMDQMRQVAERSRVPTNDRCDGFGKLGRPNAGPPQRFRGRR